MLRGSAQTNVIPDTAYAELDGRLLPGQDPQVFLSFEELLAGFQGLNATSLGPANELSEIDASAARLTILNP